MKHGRKDDPRSGDLAGDPREGAPMNDGKLRGILGDREASDEQICRASALGVRDALREHKRLGNPIVTRDHEHERIVLVPPEEIELPDEPDDHEAQGDDSTT